MTAYVGGRLILTYQEGVSDDLDLCDLVDLISSAPLTVAAMNSLAVASREFGALFGRLPWAVAEHVETSGEVLDFLINRRLGLQFIAWPLVVAARKGLAATVSDVRVDALVLFTTSRVSERATQALPAKLGGKSVVLVVRRA